MWGWGPTSNTSSEVLLFTMYSAPNNANRMAMINLGSITRNIHRTLKKPVKPEFHDLEPSWCTSSVSSLGCRRQVRKTIAFTLRSVRMYHSHCVMSTVCITSVVVCATKRNVPVVVKSRSLKHSRDPRARFTSLM